MFSLSARVGGDLISYEFIFVLTACLNLGLSYLPPLPKCDLLTATLQTCAWCFEEWRYLLQNGAGSDSGKGWVQTHCRVCAQRGVEVALSNQTAPSDEINFRGCDQVCKCVVQVSVCVTAPFFSSEKKLRLQGTNCSNDEIFFPSLILFLNIIERKFRIGKIFFSLIYIYIYIYIIDLLKCNLFLWWQSWILSSLYSSLQCHMIRNHSNMLIWCSRNTPLYMFSYINKQTKKTKSYWPQTLNDTINKRLGKYYYW